MAWARSLRSRDLTQQAFGKELFERIVVEEGQTLLGWRMIETDASSLGESARAVEPLMWHAIVGRGPNLKTAEAFERKLYVIRKRFESEIEASGLDDHRYFYFASLSCRTLVYKGMLTTEQLGLYFADDLGDSLLTSALCMFHSRFSTNTFPSWQLAHPYRMISHNGEINTLRGNINWMRAREALFASDLYEPGDIAKIKPIIREGLSDTACLDNALELLVRSGYSLSHAMIMLIPEAWENHDSMSQEKKDFYKFQSCLMEPWDGPASVAFTDGKSIGAVLDRNGLRPSRYVVTDDDRVIMASEVGALEIAPERIVKKGRLEPGKMFLVDLRERPDRGRRRDQARVGHGAPLWSVAAREDGDSRRSSAGPRASPSRSRRSASKANGVWLHARRPEVHRGARWARQVKRRSGRWVPTRHWPCSRIVPSRSSIISSSSSPRSRIHRWTPSERSWSRRYSRVPAAKATCSTPTSEACRQIALDTADSRQRRTGSAQEARRLGRVQVDGPSHAVRGREGRGRVGRALKSLIEQACDGDRDWVPT